MAKRKVSKKKITILVIALILILGVASFFIFFNKDKKDDTIKVESVDKIEGYDYTLKSTATKYYKSLFKELKDVLESDDKSEEKYAELVAKLFVADFFNLDNKVSKTDIGGLQFVYKDYRSDFEKFASTSIYKSVESNVYGDRKQSLPVVIKVSTETPVTTSFKYGDNTDDKAYKINFDIEYKEDLGYQKSGVLTLIHTDKKFEVAVMEESSVN